jgi:hypothetical protein
VLPIKYLTPIRDDEKGARDDEKRDHQELNLEPMLFENKTQGQGQARTKALIQETVRIVV